MKTALTSDDWEAIRVKAPNAPHWFCRHFLGVDLWDLQVKVMESVRDNDRTAVVGCHSIGKSFLTACTILWFLLAHKNAYVVLTAPTWKQVCEVMWAEVRRLFHEAPVLLGPGPLHTPKWQIADKWKCLGFSSKEPERVQGFHSDYVLVIIDEASGVPDKLFEGLRSLLASGIKVRILLLSNPTRPEGELHRAFHGARHMYKTFQISAWDTPNLRPIKDACLAAATPQERWAIMRAAEAHKPRPRLISPKFVADTEEMFGWDSDVYRVRCLGEFPKGGPNQLLPLNLIQDAVNRHVTRHYGDGYVHDKTHKMIWTRQPETPWWDNLSQIDVSREVEAGLDVARLGDNLSVFVPRLDTIVGPFADWQGIDTVELVSHVQPLIGRYRVRNLRVDEDGLGGGPYDQLRHWAPAGLNVSGFRGGAASNNPEKRANMRAESYWGLRERLFEGRIEIPEHEILIGQLASIRYRHRAAGQVLIESKDDMVARGLTSPDFADALMMAFAVNSGGGPAQVYVPPARTRWSGMYGS